MDLKLDSNVILFISVVLILLFFVMAMKSRAGIVFKIMFRFILGGSFIYLFNFFGKLIDFTIPLNPITSIITGILEIPGFALILIIKYIIYP